MKWAPGDDAADFYRIYGLDGGSLVPLDSTDAWAAAVPGGFAGYAVAGVKLGVESPPVGACVEIDPTGPAVGFLPPCDVLPPIGVPP